MAHEFYIFNVNAKTPLKVQGFDRFDTKEEAKLKLEEWMDICKDRQPAPKYVVRARTKQS